ncbi:MAG: hypothetical protein FJ253_03800 [Phycisphaerae bacterium]|nr:hypothetical protein [Phycisphaerae bacterium]
MPSCAASPRSSIEVASNDSAASPASIAETSGELDRAVLLEEEAAQRRTPPPRIHGKRFTTSATAADGRIHRIDIRIKDGSAETRLDGRLVPAERVLVHRRGHVEILGDDGRRQVGFNLPRGMTSVANPTGR